MKDTSITDVVEPLEPIDEDSDKTAFDEPLSDVTSAIAVTSHSNPMSSSIPPGIPHFHNTVETQQDPILITPRFIGFKQTIALIGKNMLTKYRTPVPTFFEIFSPVMMMLVLVAAYTLSEVITSEAGQYTSLRFDIPGPWLDLVSQASDVLNQGNTSSSNRVKQRNLKGVETVGISKRNSFALLQGLGLEYFWDDINTNGKQTARRLQNLDDEVVTEPNSTKNTNVRSIFEILDSARAEIRDILSAPLPVPSFSQYVLASQALSSYINVDDLSQILSDSSVGREWGNLLTLGTIHLSPNIPVVDEFRQYLNEILPALLEKSVTVRTHQSESDAINFIKDNLNERTWALLDFSNYQDMDNFHYTIRMNYTTLPNTNMIVNLATIGLSRRYQRYYLSGFLSLQRTLNEFAMSRINCTNADTNLWSMPMPTAPYSQNAFFKAVGFLLGLTIAMAYLYPTSRTIKSMVEEKECRMKETLFILGVRPWAHWLSWVVTTSIIFFVIAILVTVTLSTNVLMHSSPAYLFTFIGLFSTATIGFCFVIASFFSRAKLAAIVGPMALFATLLPRFIFFGSNRYEAITSKKLASLLPCTAFAFGADIIADYEYAEVGVQAFNANEGEYSFNTTLQFLLFDTVFYMFLGWYLELVIPRQYGVARPFYFLVLPSYWWSFMSCYVGRQSPGGNEQYSSGVIDTNDEVDSTNFEGGVNSEDIEPVMDVSLVPRVSIHGLVKKYNKKDDTPPAVNNLNLTLYESQITCLLGHNGAGKTSTISILTGLSSPTSGDCLIYGNSIVTDATNARQSMGICPQHNILFDRLTVIEHLAFFQRIKGLTPTIEDVRDKAIEVGLGEYLKTTSSALSGGNKRKLSLAIALCGDPRFLLLDEPTSGMDPASRRACWELLRRKRVGRVTLLTTHFLDEASLLADRIAVMKEGRLQCCGSELFLKNRFGLGYNLTVVLNESQRLTAADNSVENYRPETSDMHQILAYLREFIQGTELIRKSAKEITFRFPQGLEGLFPDVFDALESARDSLGIGAYGISNTTLEEVFLQLAERENPSNVNNSVASFQDSIQFQFAPSAMKRTTETETGSDELIRDERDPETSTVTQEDLVHISPFRQVILLYMKRLLIQRRDLKGAFFMIVLPVLLCGLVLLILTLDIVLAGPAIEMSMSLFQSNTDGMSGLTDVEVGGGGSMTQNANPRLSDKVSNLSTTLHSEYPNTNFVYLVDAKSSSNMSQHLLDTYNDHNHNERYGAFALRDTIPLQVTINWDELRNDINNSIFGVEKILDLSNVFQIANDYFQFDISAGNSADIFFGITMLSSNSTVNTSLLQSITSKAIENIINSAKNPNASVAVDVVQNVRTASFKFIDEIYLIGKEGQNDTIIQATGRFSDAITLAVTRGEIDSLKWTNISDIFGALKEIDASFDRLSIQDGWVDLFNGFFTSVDERNVMEVNSTVVVQSLLQFYDALAESIDNSTKFGPNTLLLIPLIIVNEVLLYEIAQNSSTIKVEDLVFGLVDLLRENSGVFGFFQLRAESVVLHTPTLRLSFLNVSIETSEGFLLENEDFGILLNGTGLLPSGIRGYNFALNSTASILHNSSSPHGVATFNQAYMEFLFKQCASNPEKARLVSVNHPLPLTTQQSIEIQTTLSVLASLFLLIPYCYIPAAFIVFLVKERVSKSKHIQLVSGVNVSSYWISAYLWDLSLFFGLSVLIILVFLIYGRESAAVFVGDTESLLATFVLTFGYGLASLPFAYLLSRFFSNHSSAQIAIMGIFFMTGFVAVNAYFILSSIESTKKVAEVLRPYFRTWPAYNVGEGFINLSNAYWERQILGLNTYAFDWDVTGRSLAILYGSSVAYFLTLLMLEYSEDGGSGGFAGRVLRNIRGRYEQLSLRWHGVRKADDGISLMLDDGLDESTLSEDTDVAAERTYVTSNTTSLKMSASVLLIDLWKVYPPSVGIFGSLFVAVRKVGMFLKSRRYICFHGASSAEVVVDDKDRFFLPKRAVRGVTTSIPQGETFGLLGVNGAGKTTMMGVLTGDIHPSSGQAYVAGHDVTGVTPGGVDQARKHIGFCPQVDPLLDLMTGRETLEMFGKLRGIPASHLQSTVTDLLTKLTLTPYADKVSESYSGGNKRKLSLGVALIGDPRVLFIDEASSGMDPAARRHMWELISKVSQKRSTILTSHSMEEAEALCTRVAIMVNGQMLCLGSVQHVKTKYLDGYTIDVHCIPGTAEHVIDGLVHEVLLIALPGSILAERHGRFLRFDVSSLRRLGLGTTFRRLQELKEREVWKVENYSISQCSLEQVFIKLVKQSKIDAASDRMAINVDQV